MPGNGRKSEGTTAAPRATAQGGALDGGCSPASLSSPMSSGSGGAFEPNCSLDRFMETLDALSPDGQSLHVDKRQSVESNNSMSMTPFGGSRVRRGSNASSSRNGNNTSFASGTPTPSSCSRATPNLRLRRSSGGGGGGAAADASRMSIGSEPGCLAAPDGAGGDDSTNSVASTSTSTTTTIPCSSSNASWGLKTPRTGSHHGHFTRVRRNSPVKLDPSSSSPTTGGSERGRGGGGASGSRSPKRKRSYAQLAAYENGAAPSPFPSNGAPKSSSRVLSNSSLTVHKDGAYMQVTFDETHRFAHEEDTPMNPLGESLMNDPFLATPEPIPMPVGERKDIDQALSLLQLSGGSASKSDLTRSARRNSGPSTGGKMTPGPASTLFPPLNAQEAAENIVPGSSTGASAAITTSAPAAPTASSASTAAPAAPAAAAANTTWGANYLTSVPGLSSPSTSALPPPPSPFSMAAAATAAQRFLPPPPPPPQEVPEKGLGGSGAAGGGKRAGTKGFSGGAKGGKAGGSGGATVAGTRAKARPKGKGAIGGQRAAVQAPVSKPQGTKGGGPGSFCSKPEALSQLDTSQSDQMVLDADLWIVRERGDICTASECIYKDKSTGISSRRHYHATCDHRHKKGGPKGGMIFHHHQLEKIQKHQRAHIRTLHKKTPAEAVLSEGNVEPYLPNAWTEEEASVLAHLVGLYGPTNWGIIAAGVATKSETQCMLHWRFALNGNATVKGTGTWQSVEDERMLSLVQIFGQRWSTVAEHMPGRLAKQCRERYLNNLDPELRRGTWSREEDEKLLQLRGQENKSFAKIAERIEGRSYNDVKNRWSQISRQIAALKKQSEEEKGRGDGCSNSKAPQRGGGRASHKRDGEAAAAGADGGASGLGGLAARPRSGASATAAAASDADSNAAGRSAGAAHGGGGGIARRGSARTEGTAAAAGAGARKATTRYKVYLRGGIPTLLEADEADPTASVGEGGSQEGPSSSPPPAAAASTTAKDEPVCSPCRGDIILGIPPTSSSSSSSSSASSAAAAAAAAGEAPAPASGSAAAASPAGLPHGVFMGIGLEGVGEAAAAAAADFGPQMTEAEAASIAGGSLFGYGSDMRVSI